ncbi:hypothetical protein M514_01552 [Trichuris suis]|uniref:Uncharacterized protein n=1 Tax=Trichuris suis TaxID=68888 RepID=A0A085NAQ9_9BILA|nr:hypothetical protein M513_01552 [Trichuris suis]KFD66555.1 hypothetical protein M514_01552 [Trichuris suis]
MVSSSIYATIECDSRKSAKNQKERENASSKTNRVSGKMDIDANVATETVKFIEIVLMEKETLKKERTCRDTVLSVERPACSVGKEKEKWEEDEPRTLLSLCLSRTHCSITKRIINDCESTKKQNILRERIKEVIKECTNQQSQAKGAIERGVI